MTSDHTYDVTGRTGSPEALPAVLLAAERLDSLAETADLMDDPDGALRFRCAAEELRMRAMGLLDE